MKIGKIVLQIGMLSIFYGMGTWMQQVFHLMIPGSLIGMLVLLGVLTIKILPLRWFELGGETLLAIMPFLLLPSSVGLMDYSSFLFRKGMYLCITAVISTLLIIVIAGYTGQYLANKKEKKGA